MDTNTLIQRIGGIPANPELQHEFQAEVGELLKIRNPRKFPGAQPVSFAAAHLEDLKRRDYYVCEKTDGIRFLMYLTNDGNGNPCHYLIDRKNDYYYVADLFFPYHEKNPDFNLFHEQTILDGELVEDRHPDGTSVVKFLVFDLLVMGMKGPKPGDMKLNDLRQRPLDKRLAYMKAFLLKPLSDWLAKHPDQKARMAFAVEDKKTEFSYALPTMFHEIIPKVKQLHGNDGLIFTCRETPYVTGTDRNILKWKPPEENTVDFLLHITWTRTQPPPEDPDQSPYDDYDAMPATTDLFVFHGGDDYAPIGSLYLTPDDWEQMKSLGKPLQDCIVECFLEDVAPTNGTNGHISEDIKRWRFHRLRDDKLEANHVSVYDNVIDSIRDHITEDDLLTNAEDIRSAWKTRNR